MHVLALDTTTREGSVALVVGDRVVDERRGDPSRTHAERLPGEVLALAAANGLSIADVDLFAVAAGPGSFTGLRIGIATMQGFAFTTGRPMVAVSALDALAAVSGADRPDAADGGLVGAWMDAHRGEVFAALYRVVAAPALEPVFAPGRVAELEGPTVGNPAATLKRWLESAIGDPGRSISFLGDGAVLYAQVIERWGGAQCRPVVVSRLTPLLAGAIGRLAAAKARRGETIAPGAVQPLYVRRPDAEIERDRKDQHH